MSAYLRCEACSHEFSIELGIEALLPSCPACGSEDTFDKGDGMWPCTTCHRPACVNYGGRCARCLQ